MKKREFFLDKGREINEQYIEEIRDIIKNKNLILTVNIGEAGKLKGKLDEEIQLFIKDVSELSVEELEQLQTGLNITYIKFKDNEQNSIQIQRDQYKTENYKKCRKAIDKILGDINFERFKDSKDREKFIFGEVIKSLVSIGYDYVQIENEKQLDKYPNKYTVEEKEEIEKRAITSRSLEGGLIGNKLSVCAGYSEIIRNVFACCGIEVRYITGIRKNKEGKPVAHAWNKIKLDGEWYNIDFTNARSDIIEERESKYLLKSDDDFEIHKVYVVYNLLGYKEDVICSKTISKEDMLKYLYNKGIESEIKKEENVQYYVPEPTKEIKEDLKNVLMEKRKWILKNISSVREQEIYRSYQTLITSKDKEKLKEDGIYYE